MDSKIKAISRYLEVLGFKLNSENKNTLVKLNYLENFGGKKITHQELFDLMNELSEIISDVTDLQIALKQRVANGYPEYILFEGEVYLNNYEWRFVENSYSAELKVMKYVEIESDIFVNTEEKWISENDIGKPSKRQLAEFKKNEEIYKESLKKRRIHEAEERKRTKDSFSDDSYNIGSSGYCSRCHQSPCMCSSK